MAYTDTRLNEIYDKTDGCCHLCHKKLSFKNYAILGAKGNWEVEHSVARANGGSNHLNNLFPSCIQCNRDKGTYSTRTARNWYGQTNAPYSRARKTQIEEEDNYNTGLAILGVSLVTLIGIGIASKNNNRSYQTRRQLLKIRRSQ